METALLWLSHKKCMVKILIGRKCYVSTTSVPNFKIMCNCIIHELLNVFEDSAQPIYTIVCIFSFVICSEIS